MLAAGWDRYQGPGIPRTVGQRPGDRQPRRCHQLLRAGGGGDEAQRGHSHPGALAREAACGRHRPLV